MISHEWDAREVIAFNALFCSNPHAKRIANKWPEATTVIFVFSTKAADGSGRRATAHFCLVVGARTVARILGS